MKKINEHPLAVFIGLIASLIAIAYTIFVFWTGRPGINDTDNKVSTDTLNREVIYSFDDNVCDAMLLICKSATNKFEKVLKPPQEYSETFKENADNQTIFKSDTFNISSVISQTSTSEIVFYRGNLANVSAKRIYSFYADKIKSCTGAQMIDSTSNSIIYRFENRVHLQNELDCSIKISFSLSGGTYSRVEIHFSTWEDWAKKKKDYKVTPPVSRFK